MPKKQQLEEEVEFVDAEVDAFEFDIDEEAILSSSDPTAVDTGEYQLMITKAIPELSREDAKNFPLSRRIALWFKIIQNASMDLDEGTLYRRVRFWLALPSKAMRSNPEYWEGVNNSLRKFLSAINMTIGDFQANLNVAHEEAGGLAEDHYDLWGVEGTELSFLHEGVCSAYLTLEENEEFGAQNRISRFIIEE